MSFFSAPLDSGSMDLGVVIIANVINALIVAIFVARASGHRSFEHRLGMLLVLLALPLVVVVVTNAMLGREWWTIVLPGLMVGYLVMELVLDYLFKIQFRQTLLLWPYLAAFYLALMSMIGYAFLIDPRLGYVTLFTYFLGLLATWYSHAKAGHG